MMIAKPIDRLLPYLALAAFFTVSIAVRPLLPVDETRYLSVSWEMFLRQNFLVPTLNFEPYFQKPPLLFWLIDLAWSVFGVSRDSGSGGDFRHLVARALPYPAPGDSTLSERRRHDAACSLAHAGKRLSSSSTPA